MDKIRMQKNWKCIRVGLLLADGIYLQLHGHSSLQAFSIPYSMCTLAAHSMRQVVTSVMLGLHATTRYSQCLQHD